MGGRAASRGGEVMACRSRAVLRVMAARSPEAVRSTGDPSPGREACPARAEPTGSPSGAGSVLQGGGGAGWRGEWGAPLEALRWIPPLLAEILTTSWFPTQNLLT